MCLCVSLFPSHLLNQSIDFNETWCNIVQLENSPTPHFVISLSLRKIWVTCEIVRCGDCSSTDLYVPKWWTITDCGSVFYLFLCTADLLKKHFCVVFLRYITDVLMLLLLRLQSALRIDTQNVSCWSAVVLAPRRILSAKGNHLEVHRSLFQSVLVCLWVITLFNCVGNVANCGAHLCTTRWKEYGRKWLWLVLLCVEWAREAAHHLIWDSWLVSGSSFELRPSDCEAEVLPAGSFGSVCLNELDL